MVYNKGVRDFMQIVVVSTDNGFVAEHFGRCPNFTIAKISGGKILEKTVIPNPGHETGFLPKFFSEKNANILISGGVGARAITLFEEYGIKTILGVSGKVDSVLEDFINGKLKGNRTFCLPGKGKGYGIKKIDGYEK
jgi:predicted Fe-Mo cluster-binding NifX family protein